jgi:hypothetical protein
MLCTGSDRNISFFSEQNITDAPDTGPGYQANLKAGYRYRISGQIFNYRKHATIS